MFKAIFSALVLLFASHSLATEIKVGDWTVHYSALPSTFLTPEVARTYQIERSRYNGILNIAVQDQDGTPLQVNLNGEGKTLIGTVRKLEFQTVREGDAIYYIAEYPYRNEDNVLFTIDIQSPTQGGEFSFRHTFYTD
ncbi:DUF4426 domain-containing protein [Oceanisphaera psychrotolerans]|uniref:DUF4426 domain-containing protein n=1 Tax=Oceanisphaera psychrotolerans TaxID=1414654 RepID=A0A1J4QC78_9GAMM|nr:DUF4426 domain-containing protein [Oceanisphaera psychrotolerans]OIN08826.1 hypothetical protein BFR47_15025 [Oceanisphaera psychrotolerans]